MRTGEKERVFSPRQTERTNRPRVHLRKMIEFNELGENVDVIRDYAEQSEVQFCDISVGVKYMWRDDFVIDYAVYNGTLILRESCPDYKDSFYYPMGKDVSGALKEIENYCKTENIPLSFCCLDEAAKDKLSAIYPFAEFSFDRAWSDYIYNARDFVTYAGKKFSGQRNHVNKFRKTYPNYKVKPLTENDLPRVYEFLKEYERETVVSMWSEQEEEKKVADYIGRAFALKQLGCYIEVNSKIVALSVGEIVKDTLIVHVEKGLKSYAGVYPAMANEFAKAFVTDEVKYINREEDCGDPGLRVSKTQYHPVLIKNKYTGRVKTAFDNIQPPISVKTERLVIDDITEKDGDAYAALYTDGEINEYYGYDYREDIGDAAPTPEYFLSFMRGLKEKKEEYSVAVRKDGVMIGELVLYNFGFRGEAEIGFRFFKDSRGKGYAAESVGAFIAAAREKFGITRVNCRAYKKNAPSVRLIERLGFTLTGETADMSFYALEPR